MIRSGGQLNGDDGTFLRGFLTVAGDGHRVVHRRIGAIGSVSFGGTDLESELSLLLYRNHRICRNHGMTASWSAH